MKFFKKIAIVVFSTIASALVFLPQSAAANEAVGVRQITAHSEERNIDLAVTVWYPPEAGGSSVMLGESIFFVGTPAMLDAPIPNRKYPLILLSHGAGIAGNAVATSWIAAPLANRGFIVAAPTHPGNGGASRSAAETMKLWVRPADITETLNSIIKNDFFKDHIKRDEVGMLGLSMGGGTALAIAGAQIDPVTLSRYCDTDALNASLCQWVKQSGVDLHSMDMTSAGRYNRDRRIKFVMAIDPAPVDVLAPDSLSKISIPVDLVNLGRTAEIPQTVRADGVAKVIGGSSYSTIEDASHYSMFAECKPGAAKSAEIENVGDPICADGNGRPRSMIHRQLIDIAVAAFKRELMQGP
ncbi:alpha/beta hydrolase family protein [Agrobacterium rosae]|uniref:alpha/beta hydrolase family protein n=1 Tax=Agrobacterium rosae TaxID=1972867 RepID=UPI003A8009CB